MRIKEGRIGCQESAAMVGTAVYVSMVFSLNSSEAYRGGNSTYLWIPIITGLMLGAVLLTMYLMEKNGINTLDILFRTAFGKTAGSILCGVMILLFILSAFELLADFLNMVHSFVFYDQPYWNITLWITASVALLGVMGMECIGRTGRLLLPAFGFVLLLWLLLPLKSFELSNLYPFPGNTPKEIGGFMLKNAAAAFSPMIAVLAVTNGMHGMKYARNACGIGALCALCAVALSYLCLGLTYGYKDLLEMPYPLYRLDMMMPEEGYFFRMDKIALFFWLTMGIISAAYYVFAASLLWCRCWGPKDTRPGVLCLCVLIGCAVQLQAEGNYDKFAAVMQTVDKWSWTVVLLPVLAGGTVLLRKTIRRRMKA